MRRPRNLQPNTFVHITNRCEGFFLEEVEMLSFFLKCLREACLENGIVILAYCILANHLHLLSETGQEVEKLSKMMHDLETKVACYYNRCKGRRGHFWQDRFHSTTIASQGHFRNVVSYIDANPLNHKDGVDPINWRYCSYHELQVDSENISLIDRARLIKAMKMVNIRQFTEWQRQMMEKRKGTEAIAKAQEAPRFRRHYAVGTRQDLKLLQNTLRKHGIFSYGSFLEEDENHVTWWALDLCCENFAKRKAAWKSPVKIGIAFHEA